MDETDFDPAKGLDRFRAGADEADAYSAAQTCYRQGPSPFRRRTFERRATRRDFVNERRDATVGPRRVSPGLDQADGTDAGGAGRESMIGHRMPAKRGWTRETRYFRDINVPGNFGIRIYSGRERRNSSFFIFMDFSCTPRRLRRRQPA